MAAMVFIIKYLSKYLSISAVTPFIDRSEGWSLRSVGILDQVAAKMCFFSPKFKSAENFSAPAQEGNLFFLSGRSARKKNP